MNTIKTEKYEKYALCGCYIQINAQLDTSSTSKDTIAFPKHKIEYAKSNDRPAYFVFSLKDGIFYKEYDEIEFDSFETDEENVLIPVNRLNKGAF